MLIKARVGARGEIIIPQEIREQLGLHKGVKITVEAKIGEIVVKKLST